MGIRVSEDFVNATRGYIFGGSVYETGANTRAELFRFLQNEYGRCISKMYVDTPDGGRKAVGWIFSKRMRYEGARENSESDFYVREVWVTIHEN